MVNTKIKQMSGAKILKIKLIFTFYVIFFLGGRWCGGKKQKRLSGYAPLSLEMYLHDCPVLPLLYREISYSTKIVWSSVSIGQGQCTRTGII